MAEGGMRWRGGAGEDSGRGHYGGGAAVAGVWGRQGFEACGLKSEGVFAVIQDVGWEGSDASDGA
jgi:hypothetical protein